MKKIPKLNKVSDGKRVYYSPTLEEKNKFILVKNELEKKYSINTSSRDVIIKQLISTLTDGDYINYEVEKIGLVIIRTDIKNFYPSIDKHRLYKKLLKANMVSSSTLQILKPMFFSRAVRGVPLGLPFSSVLAEIYLETFDKDIYQNFNPTFYFRYVDDIIIINYDTINQIDLKIAKEALQYVFDKNFLEINDKKSEFKRYAPKSHILTDLHFEYLGYFFKVSNNFLHIKISISKYKKITNTIKKYFYLFKKGNRSNKQFWRLYYRLKNSLYGITSSEGKAKKMNFGLGYSYRFVNNEEQIAEIIHMVKGLIHSCNLSSKKQSALLHLVFINASPLELMKKRFDYTRLTTNQMNELKRRLQINASNVTVGEIFHEIYRD